MVSAKAVARSLRERADFVEQAVVADLTPIRAVEIEDHVISMAAGPSDELVVLSSPVPWAYRPSVEARLLMESGWPATAHVITLNDVRVLPTPDLRLPHRHVQPLPDGRWIVVAPRTYPRGADPEPNAFVMNDGGTIEHAFVIGDCVDAMKTTAAGQIWVGYGDEGVFGNNHFGEESGLARWNSLGEREWAFTQPDGEQIKWDWVSAINVCDGDIWVGGRVCVGQDDNVSARPGRSTRPYYSVFSAVDGQWTALVGSGGWRNQDLIFLNHPEMAPDALEGPILVKPPGHGLLPTDALVDVRGDTIHYLVDNAWFSIDVPTLVTARTGK